jgi:biotin-dependent carboxylase-like uncharacterized protein
MIEVTRSGLLATVQDLGRPGYAHLGVARSGALDAPALIRANRLVGNADGAAGVETTINGIGFRTEVRTMVAVTGARSPVRVGGETAPFGVAFPVPAGVVVDVGAAESGVRTYVAFAGGVSVAQVLGSRSSDTLSGLGPPPLRPGFVLPLGRSSPDGAETVPVPFRDPSPDPVPDREPSAEILLRLRMGPRHDWFSVSARDALLETPYTVSVKSNRVGARLSGLALSRTVAGELPSEGIVLGAVQVPADGQPLVFLADHPTTGGYPVVGVVDLADLPLLAQARPGTTVRFAPWT